MKIHKITLSNFRTHKFFEFEPMLDGITTIRGVNGAGKSTILDALSWCLYGVKPSGVAKNQDLVNRYSKAPKDEDCYVEVVFTMDGRQYRVKREIVTKTKTSCSLEQMNDKGEYVSIADNSASTTGPEIRKVLRMTKDDFFAAVHIQQKKVDALVDPSSKTNRANVIQNLIGVSGLTESIKVANENLRSEKKAIAQSSFDGKTLEESKKQLKDLTSLSEKLDLKKNSLQERVSKGKIVVEEARAKRDEKLENFNKTKTLQATIDSLAPSIENDEKEIEELSTRRAELKKQVAAVENSAGDFNKISDELADLEKRHKKASQDLFNAEQSIDSLTKEETELQETVKQSKFGTVEECDKERESVSGALKTLRQEIDDIKNKMSSWTSQANDAKNAIGVIESGQCPTCLQEVHDKEESIRSLESKIEQHREDYKQARSSVKEKEQSCAELESRLEGLESLSNAIGRLEQVSVQLQDLRASVGNLKHLEGTLDADVKSQRNIFYAAKEVEKTKTDARNTKDRLLTVTERLDKNTATVKSSKAKLKELPQVSESSVESAKNSASKAETLLDSLKDQLSEVSTDLTVTLNNIEHTKENIVREEENSKKYVKMLENSERLSASVETLSEFKQNRIDSAIPTVEAFASTLLSSFTDDVMSSIELDDTFTVTITKSDGEKFGIGELSGGEESVVAIALRVAISMMLVSGTEGFPLILDEVLFALDDRRTPKVLQGIKNTHSGQIIIIDHKNDAVDEVVDKVITL